MVIYHIFCDMLKLVHTLGHDQSPKPLFSMFVNTIACPSEGWDLGGSNLAVGGYDRRAIAHEPRGRWVNFWLEALEELYKSGLVRIWGVSIEPLEPPF